jgi:predicted phosphodiesterase
MTVAALYDIHGNLPALEAVLAEVREAAVDEIVIGGDVCPGPMCGEVLDLLTSLHIPVRFLRGNGDREVLSFAAGEEVTAVPELYRPAMRWVAQQLTPAHRELMAQWPSSLELDVEEHGRVLFCHATPDSDTFIFTRNTPEAGLLPRFAGLSSGLVVCGHTHMQFDRMIGSHRVINAGSVGMPFGEPGAYWLHLGEAVQLRRTNYDRVAAAGRICATAYPEAASFARGHVLEPPTEQVMLELFGDPGC